MSPEMLHYLAETMARIFDEGVNDNGDQKSKAQSSAWGYDVLCPEQYNARKAVHGRADR
jgi:hypothetical protein